MVITLLWIIFTFLIWEAAVMWNWSCFLQLLNHNEHVILAQELWKIVFMKSMSRKMGLKSVDLLDWKHCFYKYNELNTFSPSVSFLGPTFQLLLRIWPHLTTSPLPFRSSSSNNLDDCNIFWITISSSSLMLLQSIFKTSGTKWPWKWNSKYNKLPPYHIG